MLKIYGIPLSPFVRKVHWALAYKGVEFESVPTMPADDSAEFRAMSPLGKIPAMDHDGFTVSDSSIIIRYLESQFPEKPLYPSGPENEARVCWLEEFADTKLADACAVFFRERLANPRMMNQPTDRYFHFSRKPGIGSQPFVDLGPRADRPNADHPMAQRISSTP